MTKTILTALIATLAAGSVLAADPAPTASTPAAAPVKAEKTVKTHTAAKKPHAKGVKAIKVEPKNEASAPAQK